MPREGKAFLLVAVAVLSISIAAYAPTIGYPYLQDSVAAVETNPIVARGDAAEIFTSHYWKSTSSPGKHLYRPITVLSFALERKVAGERPDPRLSHLINILLHDLTACLLFLYVRRLGGCVFAAAVAALSFAAHPLLSQAVVNVVGRADVLATLFSLAALLCMRATRVRAGAWSTGLALFLALGSKEIAIATLPLLVWQELLFQGPPGGRDRARWFRRATAFAPSAVAVLLFLALRTFAIEDFPGLQEVLPLNNVLVGTDGLTRVATTLAMAATYARLLVVPLGLSADYSGLAIERVSSVFSPAPLFGLLVLAGLTFLVFAPPILSRRWANEAPAGTGNVFSMGAALTLFPYLVIGNVLVLNGTGFAERMIYFSATGFCVLLGISLSAVRVRLSSGQRTVGAFVLAVVLLAAVGQARVVSRMWSGAEALFETSLRATPGSLRSHFALAEIRERQGRLDEALSLHEASIRVWPEHAPSWLYMGVVLARLKRLPEAEAAIRRSVEIRPDVAESWMYLGFVLNLRAKHAEAERALRKALLIEPRLTEAEAQLGHLLFREGRYAEAARSYQRCLQRGREDLRPDFERALAAAGPRLDTFQRSDRN